MITEIELKKAIEDCQSQPNPNANTCIKLASYLTILDSMNKQEERSYSYAPHSTYTSGSEFSRISQTKSPDAVMRLVDDLATTLQVVNPRLYNNFIDKLLEL